MCYCIILESAYVAGYVLATWHTFFTCSKLNLPYLRLLCINYLNVRPEVGRSDPGQLPLVHPDPEPATGLEGDEHALGEDVSRQAICERGQTEEVVPEAVSSGAILASGNPDVAVGAAVADVVEAVSVFGLVRLDASCWIASGQTKEA